MDHDRVGGRGGPSLEYTPTWVAALLCTIIITISLVIEKLILLLSKRLKRMNRRFLYKALEKLKEELMLMGFISLLLASLQDAVVKICIPQSWARKGLPCKFNVTNSTATTTHHYCQEKGKVPLLSYEALHDLHILIFVLAVVHVLACALTVLFGAAKIRQWKKWEESILGKMRIHDVDSDTEGKIIHVKNDDFIKKRFMGVHANKRIWLRSFAKHLYGSVTESDYAAMRTGFVLAHCKGNPNFNFYEYMMLAFEADFREVVVISWYVWVIVVISLLLNLAGWHTHIWIATLPLILLLIVGTKLEQVIAQLATEVVRRQSIIAEGNVKIEPSDHYFWFHKPRIVLLFIRIVLSCNSFTIALFFWISSQYGFEGCSMDRVVFSIPRLIIVLFVQIICSYSTLPLYAIVTQMGSTYHKKAMQMSCHGSSQGGATHKEWAGSESTYLLTETVQLAKVVDKEDQLTGKLCNKSELVNSHQMKSPNLP